MERDNNTAMPVSSLVCDLFEACGYELRGQGFNCLIYEGNGREVMIGEFGITVKEQGVVVMHLPVTGIEEDNLVMVLHCSNIIDLNRIPEFTKSFYGTSRSVSKGLPAYGMPTNNYHGGNTGSFHNRRNKASA